MVSLNAFVVSFSLARLGATMLVLFSLHLLRYPRCFFPREFVLYCWLIAYMVIQLVWTADVALAMNTLIPAVTFLVVLIQFGALATYHNVRVVLAGALAGLLIGMTLYTAISGFPFAYPAAGFSYNALAGMYLLGLLLTLILGVYARSRMPYLVVAAVLMLMIVATTSIKTNLGIVLGAVASGIVYARHMAKVIRRAAVTVVVLAGFAAYWLATNAALMDKLQRGTGRVAVGIPGPPIPRRRGRLFCVGYQGHVDGRRSRWMDAESTVRLRRRGVSGGFRNHIPFHPGGPSLQLRTHRCVSVLRHLSLARVASLALGNPSSNGLRATILGGLVCYLFITLSGTMHYNAFLAAFIGISVALLARDCAEASHPGIDSALVKS